MDEQANSWAEYDQKIKAEEQKLKDYYHIPQKITSKEWIKFAIMMVLFCLILGIAIYFISPNSRVQTIEYSMSSKVTDLHQLKKTNPVKINRTSKLDFILHHKQYLQELKRKNSTIKDIKYHFKGSELILDIENYKPSGYAYIGSKKYLVLPNGYLKLTDNINNVTTEFSGFKDKAKLSKVVNKYLEIPQKLQDDIIKIEISSKSSRPNQLTVTMSNKNKVILDMNTFNKIEYYPSISSKYTKPIIVDLEVGGFVKEQ